MKGILFKDFLKSVFFAILVFYFMVNLIVLLLSLKDNKYDECKYDGTDDKLDKIKDIVQMFVIIICNILVLHFTLKQQIIPMIIVTLIVTFMLALVLISYSIWEFIRDVFIKSHEYNLTKEKESTLFIAGYFSFIGCCIIGSLNDSNIRVQFVSELPIWVKDFLKMITLNLWYFLNSFFILTFLILSLHKIVNLCKIKKYKKEKKQKKNKDKRHNQNTKNYYIKIREKIKLLRSDKVNRKITYCISCVIGILGDIIMIILNAGFEWVRMLAYIIIKFPFIVLCNFIRKIINRLGEEQGKTIIVLSRISLIISLIVVYWVDKYSAILSSQGSEIYEFLCSVILIPLFITQLTDLKNKNGQYFLAENQQQCNVENDK